MSINGGGWGGGGVEIKKSRSPLAVEVWMFSYSFSFFLFVSFYNYCAYNRQVCAFLACSPFHDEPCCFNSPIF